MDALRRAFHDISVGYTKSVIFGNTVYIKHLNYSDQIENDIKKEEFFNEAEKQGLYNNEKKLNLLKQEGLWSDQKELDLINSKKQIEELIDSKNKHMTMPSLVKNYNEMIRKEEEIYNKKLFDKRVILGLTCESYSEKQLTDYYIFSNLFKDKELNVTFFTQQEFDYLTENEMDVVTEAYNKSIDICSDLNIKKLAMQSFFQNYFGLTGDVLGQFFGKPISQLTFFQVRLLSYGAHFRTIYSNHEVSKFPPNVRNDPDLLTDYASAAAKGKKEMENQGAYDDDAIVIGAKKEDATILGLKSKNNVAKEIANKGGNVLEWIKNRG